MTDYRTNVTGERIVRREDAPVASVSPTCRLIGIEVICPGKVGLSKRAFIRLCDGGLAPKGCKLGARRLWNEAELDAWIAAGCPAVTAPKGRSVNGQANNRLDMGGHRSDYGRKGSSV